MDNKVLVERQEWLAVQELQVRLDHLGHWVQLVRQVTKGAQEIQVILDSLEILGHRDLKVQLDSLDNLDPKASQAIVVHLVHLDFLDLLAQLDLKDSQVLKDSLDHKGQVATREILDSREIQGWLE